MIILCVGKQIIQIIEGLLTKNWPKYERATGSEVSRGMPNISPN